MIQGPKVISRKVMDTVIEQMDKFIASIDDETKQKIIDLSDVPDEELMGVNIQINASSFLNFIDAFRLVEEARLEAEEKAKKHEDKAKENDALKKAKEEDGEDRVFNVDEN